MNRLYTSPGFENDKRNIAIDFDGVVHNLDKAYRFLSWSEKMKYINEKFR